MNYFVLDSTNKIINIVVWDGVTNYNPGEGLTLILVVPGYNIGDIYVQ